MATTTTQLLEPSVSTPKKPRIRKAKKKVKSDVHELYDGDATLFRTPNSGKVYQFQMWLHKEQKYVRKSTRARNLEQAVAVGKEYFLDIHTKIRINEPIFSKTFFEVSKEYLEEILNGVGESRTHGRFVTIRSQIKHVLKFAGETSKVTDVKETKWKEYFQFRKSISPNVVNTTLKNEMSTIKHFYRFLVTRRYLLPTYQPQFPITKNNDFESRKRSAFSRDDWRLIYRFFTTNKWKKHHNPKVVEQREFIKDFAIILINTGLRFGELRKLKWKNVVVERNIEKKKNDDTVSVKIELAAEQTKNNKERIVIGSRGDVFTRLKRNSNYTNREDFVFVDNDTGNQIERTVYYKHWNYLIKETGLKEQRTDNSFYCFRHTFCTWRLKAGLDVYMLSKIMGTSIQFIEKHYGHVNVEMDAKRIVKKANLDDVDRLLFD